MNKTPEISSDLTRDEISFYHSLLNEELTDYDCGSLCKDANDGVPFCCVVENAVPILYKEEYELLKSRSDLWSVWEPESKSDLKLKKDSEPDSALFCKCKGVAFCERENRSISCRTFPLEPYIDKRGKHVGLVFMKEFLHGCPLTSRNKDIRQEFVDSHFIFWEALLLRKDDEYETYLRSSRRYRRHRTKTGVQFPILFPSHLKDKEYLKEYI